MRIEIILLGIIAAVFIIDFFKKKNIEIAENSVSKKIFSKKYKWIKYLTGFIILTLMFGLTTEFCMFSLTDEFRQGNYTRNSDGEIMEGRDLISFFKFVNPGNSYSNYYYYSSTHRRFYLYVGISILITFLVYIFKEPSFLNYIKKRKKNISISIIIISLLKLLIHYFIYTSLRNGSRTYGEDFAFHLDNLFIEEVWIFIPVTLLYCIIIWFFNHKIKAR